MDSFEPYRTDVLFLLVGGNPLPNYVAAMLLAAQRATVMLLHTSGPQNTAQVAGRLRSLLEEKRPDLSIVPHGIPDSDGEAIESRVQELLRTDVPSGGTVGLNYTGGTKAMAVHTYHVLRGAFPQGCFSYLDLRTLGMWVRLGAEPIQHKPIGRGVALTLPEIFKLHGWQPVPNASPWQPVDARLCAAIAAIHQEPQGFQQWRAWIETLPECPTLPDLAKHPSLEPLLHALSELCGGAAPTEGDLARVVGHDKFISCSKFLAGGWLEHHSVTALQGAAQNLGLAEVGAGLLLQKMDAKAGERPLDLDVAAVHGYHLFAVSCMNTELTNRAKLHLFEAFARARQLGGDEARLALVCYVEDSASLRQEVEDMLDTEGRIAVFGRRDLHDLTAALTQWIKKASKEVQ
jgi:hypothetical protein